MTGEEVRNKIKSMGVKLSDISIKLGITPQTLNSRLNAKNISLEFAKELSKALCIDVDYFTHEKNNHHSENMVCDNEIEYIKAKEKGLKLLPEVDFKFTGGQMELIGGRDTVKRYWYLPDCSDCEAIAQVAGPSMAPTYPSGCWVALKKVGFSIDRPTEISFGNVFGVVMEDPVTGDYHGHIKILRRYHDPSLAKKYWIARSIDRDNFDDFDIDITKVRSLWIVKQHVVSDVFL